MKGALFLAFSKLKGGGRVLAAARHNKRELQQERGAPSHIDAKRSSLNYRIAGHVTASGIDEAAKQAIAATGTTLRKDAVRVIEAVFSLPKNCTIDHRSYFDACTRWIGERFDAANILSSDVHLDEAAPHCHVLFMPLVDGRMRGSELLGGRARLAELANDFHANVATLYGLPRRAPRLNASDKAAIAKSVIERLSSASDSATRSIAWQSIRQAIERDPEPFAACLGIEATKRTKPVRNKSLAAIMTSRGKPTSDDTKHIGFAKRSKTSKPILCRLRTSVEDVSPTNPSVVTLPDSPKETFVETTRVRDSELSASCYDSVMGEFIAPTVRPQSQRHAAARWVEDRLRKLTRVQVD